MSDKVKELMEKLEKGVIDIFESDKYKSYLEYVSKFYSYSINNLVLIFLQNPNATRVAGYNTWKSKFNRTVKKGEKGIKIIAPIVYKDKKNDKADNESEDEKSFVYFKTTTVFDVSQTEGEELPSLVKKLDSDNDNFYKYIDVLMQVSPVPILFEEYKHNGAYFLEDKKIIINKNLSQEQTLKTVIHEISHSMLHFEVNKDKCKRTKEVEAESIAYIVSNYLGIDSSSYSFGYVASWSRDKELKELKASLDVILKASKEIITNIDDYLDKKKVG